MSYFNRPYTVYWTISVAHVLQVYELCQRWKSFSANERQKKRDPDLRDIRQMTFTNEDDINQTLTYHRVVSHTLMEADVYQ